MKSEILKFVLIGIGAVTLDFLSYIIYLNIVTISIAKGASFITGSILSYFGNKFWTFNQQSKSYREVLRFYLLYFSSLVVNVSTNSFLLELVSNYILPFVIATSLSVSINFLGMKFWVYKR